MTDHALVRWLERVHGIDMEFFRARLAEEMQSAISIGASSAIIDGFRYALSCNVLVTVAPVKKSRLSRLATKAREASPRKTDAGIAPADPAVHRGTA